MTEEAKRWFTKKLNGLFCPVHGSGVAKRNARIAANFAKQGREPLKMVRLHKQRVKKEAR